MLVSSFTDESFLDDFEVTRLIEMISNLNPQRLDVIILLDENDEELAKSFETNMEVLEMIKQQSAVEVRVFTPKEAFQMYTGLGRQATASHTMYRGNFQIADCLNIDVKILYKVVENRPPTIQKFSKLACRDN